MLPLDSREVVALLGGRESSATQHSGPVTNVVVDSRRAGPGSLFVALPGENTDGSLFVEDALGRGAVFCVVERGKIPPGAPRARILEVDDPLSALGELARRVRSKLRAKVFAITGSLGKTTAKEILGTVLQGVFDTERSPGSFNNAIGVPLTIFKAGEGTECLVAEVGANHVGEIAHLSRILAPHFGVVTSVAPVHLEGFGSLEGVVEAKSELAAALPPEGTLYLPSDLPGRKRFEERAACRIKLFGPGTETEWELVDADLSGLTFRIGGAGTAFLPGGAPQHLPSAAAAVAVALDIGIPFSVIRRRLAAFSMPPLRWQTERVGGATFLLDCYNANPRSVKSALRAARKLTGRNRFVAVIGDMGELGAASKHYHRALGEDLAASDAEEIFLIGEEVSATYEVLSEGGFSGRVELFRDRDALARAIARSVLPGDLLLFKASRKAKLEEVAAAARRLLSRKEVVSQPGRDRATEAKDFARLPRDSVAVPAGGDSSGRSIASGDMD